MAGVPSGQVRLIVSYAGLDPAEAAVTVSAGQTVTRDFTMGSKAEDTVVRMGEFRVATERAFGLRIARDGRPQSGSPRIRWPRVHRSRAS